MQRSSAAASAVVVSLFVSSSICVGEGSDTYGNTPQAVRPYRNFDEPYFRFFEEITPFRGTSVRDKLPAPPRTVRIGFLGPAKVGLDREAPGPQMLAGVQLAIEQANRSGGYEGIPFELVERIDQGLWGGTANEMVAFKYDDNVLAVIGSIDGSSTHVALRVALKTQMPMVNTATTDPTLTETAIPWLLRCMADDRQQGYALAHHIIGECGLKRIVAFRVNDRYGRTGIGEFRDGARRLKAPLLAELRWEPGARELGPQLDRIAALNPDALVLWGSAEDCAAVVKEVRRRELGLRIFGSDRLVCRAFLDRCGIEAEGIVGAATYDPTRDDPTWDAFQREFSKRFGHAPDAFSAHAYDGARILLDAIDQAGLNRTRIRDVLAEYKHYAGVTGTMIFDATLNDVGPVWLATVVNGQFVYRPVDFSTGETNADHARAPYRHLNDGPPANRAVDHDADSSIEVFQIGCFLPLDERGQAVVRGIESALREDASRNPDAAPIKLLTRDARDAWGDNSSALVDLVFQHRAVAVIGSTERRGTHLAEMLAAKFHFPVLSLCSSDSTITQIPLPWIFRVSPSKKDASQEPDVKDFAGGDLDHEFFARLGYDAAAAIVAEIRGGARTRAALRDALASEEWYTGRTGSFRFDALGNRIDRTGTVRAPGPGAVKRSPTSPPDVNAARARR